MVVEDGTDGAVGARADLQRAAARGVDALAAEPLDQSDDAEAGAEALFGMRPLGQNLLAQKGRVRADRGGLPGDPLDRPVGEAPVCRPLPLERRCAVIRSPLRNSSMVLAVIRASTCSRAKRQGTE